MHPFIDFLALSFPLLNTRPLDRSCGRWQLARSCCGGRRRLWARRTGTASHRCSHRRTPPSFRRPHRPQMPRHRGDVSRRHSGRRRRIRRVHDFCARWADSPDQLRGGRRPSARRVQREQHHAVCRSERVLLRRRCDGPPSWRVSWRWCTSWVLVTISVNTSMRRLLPTLGWQPSAQPPQLLLSRQPRLPRSHRAARRQPPRHPRPPRPPVPRALAAAPVPSAARSSTAPPSRVRAPRAMSAHASPRLPGVRCEVPRGMGSRKTAHWDRRDSRVPTGDTAYMGRSCRFACSRSGLPLRYSAQERSNVVQAFVRLQVILEYSCTIVVMCKESTILL